MDQDGKTVVQRGIPNEIACDALCERLGRPVASLAAAECGHAELHERPLEFVRANCKRTASRLAVVGRAPANGGAILDGHVAQLHARAPARQDGTASNRAPAVLQAHTLELERAAVLHEKVAAHILGVEHRAVAAQREARAAHDQRAIELVRAVRPGGLVRAGGAVRRALRQQVGVHHAAAVEGDLRVDLAEDGPLVVAVRAVPVELAEI